jgi:2-polyprenyl-3-methyl-5-hydroxy-6-metoxy-1,4-benzoquinol methylase
LTERSEPELVVTDNRVVDALDEAPERFDPQFMRGRLIEAEHLARYWWAAPFVEGKRVLDAGCGTAYGSDILARSGAAKVVGVDIDEEMLDAVSNLLHEAVSLIGADVRDLPFENDSFDVVVCFEVIEHVDEPEAVLDEFARILPARGLLVVSSPNRDVYPPGNPHHRREFRPDELAELVAARFGHVRLVRQHDWLASAVLNDDEFVGQEAFDAVVRKTAARAIGEELYSLALASHSKLPSTAPHVVLTQTIDVEWWREQMQILRVERDVAAARAARAEYEGAEASQHSSKLAKQLLALETEAAEKLSMTAALKDELKDRDKELRELHELRTAHAELRTAYAELEHLVRSMQSTRLWHAGQRYWRVRDTIKRFLQLGR